MQFLLVVVTGQCPSYEAMQPIFKPYIKVNNGQNDDFNREEPEIL